MSTTTTHYQLKKPEGSDYYNHLTFDNPNMDTIDAGMWANKQNGVQTASVALSENTIVITRDSSAPTTFKFVATMNYSPSMSMTVDGTSVTPTLPDGSALAANAFRIGSIVLCSLNGTSLNVYTNNAVDINAIIVAAKEACYPVGSLYMNYSNATSPSTILGFGTWERVQGRFMFAADSTHGAGSTGGEEVHTLTYAEMPVHQHFYTTGNVIVATGNTLVGGGGTPSFYGDKQSVVSDFSGGGQAHNNMPPYLAVYIWRRTE